jgi:hypothetical protein
MRHGKLKTSFKRLAAAVGKQRYQAAKPKIDPDLFAMLQFGGWTVTQAMRETGGKHAAR